MLLKCCSQYTSKFGTLSNGNRAGKGQFSFQSQRNVMPKNVQTITHFLSSHRLAKKCWKFSKLGCKQYRNWELPNVQAGFRKGRGTRDQIESIRWIVEKAREFKKNIYFWFIDYTKAFDCVDHYKLWEILKEMGIPNHLTCLLRNLHAGQKATVRKGMELWTGSKLGKDYNKAVYCHPAYLIYMQSTSCEMPD